jgi:hypothetical protein
MLNFHRTFRAFAGPLAAVSFCAALAAQAREIDPQLREYVITSCSTDAYRLCPQALGDETAAVQCMRKNRSQLNQICRVAYDKVVRVLHKP